MPPPSPRYTPSRPSGETTASAGDSEMNCTAASNKCTSPSPVDADSLDTATHLRDVARECHRDQLDRLRQRRKHRQRLQYIVDRVVIADDHHRLRHEVTGVRREQVH